MVRPNAVIAIVFVALFVFFFILAFGLHRATRGRLLLDRLADDESADEEVLALKSVKARKFRERRPVRLGREDVRPIGLRGVPRSP